jgi:hypothetical protein
VPLMHFTVGSVAERTRDIAPGYFERLLTILLDGLRTEAARTPLPSRPLREDEFVAAMTRRRD